MSPNTSTAIDPIARSSEVQDWARTGNVRYARWDGGPIEVGKAILSGWYWANDPRAIEAAANWYDGSHSLDLLLAAKVNWIWTTYSVGFSDATERPQQEKLCQFMRRCRDHGIRVSAYMSMTNLFIADMRRNEPSVEAWLQRDLEGRPIPYRAAVYQAEPTRMLACMNHPSWRAYVARRVENAANQGFDGVFFDNLWTECRCEHCVRRWTEHSKQLCGEVLPWPEQQPQTAGIANSDEHLRMGCIYDLYCNNVYRSMFELAREAAIPINQNCLIYGNFNSPYQTFSLPSNNAISTEEGSEPGMVDGHLTHNCGLLLCLAGAGAGWKPVRLEYGRGRGRGQLAKRIAEAGVGATRFVAMEPRKHQLSIAEAAAHGVSFEIAPEGEFQRDLYFRTPEAMANWSAIAEYHTFIQERPEVYCDAKSASRIVSLHASGFRRPHGDDYAQRATLIGALAQKGVMLDVRYEQDLQEDSLTRYEILLVADVWSMSRSMVNAITSFHRAGGSVVVTGDSGLYDECFVRRREGWLRALSGIHWMSDPTERNQETESAEIQSEISTHGLPTNPTPLNSRKLAALVQKLNSLAPRIVNLGSPPTVLWRCAWDRNGRLLVHLLNYHDAAAAQIHVQLPNYLIDSAEWLTPDGAQPVGVIKDGEQAVVVRQLDVYGVLRCSVKPLEPT